MNKSVDEFSYIVLGGGCFWCLEAAFNRIRGVHEVVSGYMGGDLPNPSYEQVCSGSTGHVEVVRIKFEKKVIQYYDLLKIFFTIHDPTTLDRQGQDVGSQYRSVIFYANSIERKISQSTISELDESGVFTSPIITKVLALGQFYKAEHYHQKYYENNYNQPYCRIVIDPKLAKLQIECKDFLG